MRLHVGPGCGRKAAICIKRFYLGFAGAIFDEASDEAQIAFKYAVARENMYDDSLKLVSVIRTIQTSDSFAAENAGK